MIKNYFKTAFRSLSRNRNYTVINIAGLAVGIAVCMIIFIVIQFQTGFDDFHPKKDRIYRVLTEYHHKDAATVSYGKDVPFPLPNALKVSFPQIEQVAPLFASHDDKLLIKGDNETVIKQFKEDKGVIFTTASFFEMFHFPLLSGSYASLNEPNNVLLTKETAEKYFGDWKTAVGKTIILELGGYIFEHGTDVLKVSGILSEIPPNTNFQLKMVVAYGTGATGSLMAASTDWQDRTNSGFGCYILMPSGIPVDDFNRQLSVFSGKVQSPENKDKHIIQPLSEVHYDTQTGNLSNKTISKPLLNVLWLIAAFILLIACVNFINLSTAQAVNRAKEVGVRKVLGGNKFQLQAQFIIETFLIVASAVLLAGIVTFFALPYITRLLELPVSLSLLNDTTVVLFLLTVTISVTALAGFYPSVVLSKFNPVAAFKSRIIAGAATGISLRRGLVVFQFVIAQALIIGTLVIIKQMNFFMHQPLGFDKNAIVNIPFRTDSAWFGKADYLKRQLLSINGVQAVSFSSNTPVEEAGDIWSTFRFDRRVKEENFKVITRFADEDYTIAYKLQLVAGRNLLPSGITKEFLINESLAKKLGFKDPGDVLNKEISIWSDHIKCPVVGVLKDFNDRSFHNTLAPLLITTNATMYNQAAIKLGTANIPSVLQSVKAIWQQTFPDFMYEYRFLDDKIEGFYRQEKQLSQLYKIFAAIAVFLSCLGLYGLASFMAVQRIKEVGIRKVLGATAGSIIRLFSKEFILLVSVAFVIAVPVAWYCMHQWLQGYAYRISLDWQLFISGGAVSVGIALITVSFRAMRAAMANPVKSLRTE